MNKKANWRKVWERVGLPLLLVACFAFLDHWGFLPSMYEPAGSQVSPAPAALVVATLGFALISLIRGNAGYKHPK